MDTAAAKPAPDLPQVFGRYLLLRRLSRGGMGEIFLAKLGEIQGFEKPVIIKKILPNLSADDEFVKRFIDEAQVAIKLNHANIASVFEVGRVDGDYFLALEYVEGRDLRRLITRCREERYRLPADLCMYIGRELASGLGYAHRRTDAQGNPLALVHCDISPPNVMVSFEGEVKIIDFGIAKSAIRIAGSNPNIGFGKFGYMAPEQLVKGGIVDRRTDIYAAGVVLYELLTGERLFQFPEGADYRQIARMVSKGEFLPPSHRDPALDPELDPIVCKALASRADDRYQTAEEFRDAIQAKLSQINPTISADALAHLVRQLFADEIEDERALVASTQLVDVEEFRDELTGSMFHTVTFARAGIPARPLQPQSPGSVRSAPHTVQHKRTVVGVSLAAMLAGGCVVYLVARSLRGTTGPPTTNVARTETRPPLRELPPQQALPSEPTVTVTPLPVTHEPARHVKHVRVHDEGEPRTERQTERQAEREKAPERAAPAITDQQVVAKFRTVKGEYESFKSEYGSRLEPEWNSITSEITFGKPPDKFVKVNSMLDSLRRQMAKIKNGG